MKKLFSFIMGLLIFISLSDVTQAKIVFKNEFLLENTGANAWVIDSLDDVTGDLTLQFGNSLAETFEWSDANAQFEISDDLNIEGNFSQNGLIFTLDDDNVGVGSNVDIVANQGSDTDGTLRYNATTNEWEVSNDGGGFIPVAGDLDDAYNAGQAITVDASGDLVFNLANTEDFIIQDNGVSFITFADDSAISYDYSGTAISGTVTPLNFELGISSLGAAATYTGVNINVPNVGANDGTQKALSITSTTAGTTNIGDQVIGEEIIFGAIDNNGDAIGLRVTQPSTVGAFGSHTDNFIQLDKQGGTLNGAFIDINGGVTADSGLDLGATNIAGTTSEITFSNFKLFSDGDTALGGTTMAGTERLRVVGEGVVVENTGSGDSLRVEDVASDTTPFVIDAAGQVGIGLATPTSQLDIQGTGELVELGDGTAADSFVNFDDGTDRNFGWDDSDNAISTFDQQLRFRTIQSATPPVACAAAVAGMQWMDTDTGITYTCDTSNSRNKWLSINEMVIFGDESGSCPAGSNANSNTNCNVDWGNGLGPDGSTNLGFYIPHDMTVTGYGFSEDNDACTSGSFDVEIWGTASNSDDDNYVFEADLATGLTGQAHNSNSSNVDIAGDQYTVWGLDNNCGQGIDDWNTVIYFRYRHD